MAENALSQSIDHEQMSKISTRVTALSNTVNEMVDKVVKEVCGDLDEYMAGIDKILTSQQTPVTDVQLDDFTLNLPSLLYFASSAQETLGVKDDVSKAVRNEVYNKVREKAQGTVADKDTAAELQAQQETLVNVIYNRAYKKVKLRVEAAGEMLNSVKKVMTRRIAEYEINRCDRGRTDNRG